MFCGFEENDPNRRQARIHRSTRPLLRLLGEKNDRYTPWTTTLSILTVVFSRLLRHKCIETHHRRRLSRSSPLLLSSRSSEEGSKSTTIDDSVGPNGDSSVFSCLLRQTSLSVLFASPPSSLVKPVRRRTETHHNRRLSQSSPHLLLRFSSSPSEE
ncbi:hypothetical protein DY000_02046070 [Brassica cretica]|uniref:Uncharacterized protein n=1 Tax=Brassica cretica TaxID=69181 RepID=A0ABQ7F1S7_BRACR|nr:hypothetical protein DY000_02046070 [Brassica cretica]